MYMENSAAFGRNLRRTISSLLKLVGYYWTLLTSIFHMISRFGQRIEERIGRVAE
ncbi:hypothetical protein BDV39DRAFT_172532 [Aspergillus sergii]|uniref:Uncharacterized protein n=1 Tax=Aspergillus sergii TaxID=1034303 RepID=A0A5N6X787_9EURO|nr:hypothetical protein BDV39DRAFT_172532 [Aspergillus sergii]